MLTLKLVQKVYHSGGVVIGACESCQPLIKVGMGEGISVWDVSFNEVSLDLEDPACSNTLGSFQENSFALTCTHKRIMKHSHNPAC